MLDLLKKCLISMQKSGKTLVYELNIMKNVVKLCKKSKPKRAFCGVEGMKQASFASMEISRQLELVFKFIDANGDGKISALELREFMLCLGHDKSKVAEEADSMLKYLDTNGDGFVDLNEYINALMMSDDDVYDGHDHHEDDDDGYNYDGYVDDGHYDHHHDIVSGAFEDDLMDAFLVFDADKNGLISAKELHQVLKRLGFANCSIKKCDLMIKGVDKDGDGFVNFEEFKLMMMSYGTR